MNFINKKWIEKIGHFDFLEASWMCRNIAIINPGSHDFLTI